MVLRNYEIIVRLNESLNRYYEILLYWGWGLPIYRQEPAKTYIL